MTRQKNERIRKKRVFFTQTEIEALLDAIANKEEIQEQIKADLHFGGINTEINKELIEELIEKVKGLTFPDIIIIKHE